MNRSLISSLLLLSAAGLSAQATYVTAPPGFTTTTSDGYAYIFGGYFDERSQIVDGNYKGTALAIREIALRRDDRNASASVASGKTWSNFALRVGDCDHDTVTNDWDKNYLNAPKTLLTGTLNWPSVTTTAPTFPEPWGDLGSTKGSCVTQNGVSSCTGLIFPFSAPHVYPGTNDILWEFQLFGGTLNNGATWGNYNKNYYLDGTTNRATIGGGVSVPTPYSDPIMTSCAGPSPSTRVGYAYLRCVTYAVHNNSNLPTGSSDSFELSFVVRDVRSVSGIIAVSLRGSNNIADPLSIYLGGKNASNEANVGCMPLGLDTTAPWILMAATTGAGYTSYESTRTYLKYNAAFAGLTPVYGQFAYTDPRTNQFRLSGTGRSLIFDQPTLQPWRSLFIGDYGSGNRGAQPRSGTGPAPTATNVPLLRYTL